MSDLVRTQVLLSRSQREILKVIASKSGQSLSGVIREILDARLIQQQYLEMKNAAEQLKHIYENDADFITMTELDGEAFLDE